MWVSSQFSFISLARTNLKYLFRVYACKNPSLIPPAPANKSRNVTGFFPLRNSFFSAIYMSRNFLIGLTGDQAFATIRMFLNMLYISYYLHLAVICQRVSVCDAKLTIFSRLRKSDSKRITQTVGVRGRCWWGGRRGRRRGWKLRFGGGGDGQLCSAMRYGA